MTIEKKGYIMQKMRTKDWTGRKSSYRILADIIILLLLTVSTSCNDKSNTEEILKRISEAGDSCISDALNELDSLWADSASMSYSERMKWHLIRSKYMNKAFIDMSDDSIMEDVAAYYDKNGSSEEKMMAHYLLGCTYRDKGDNPKTLQCYQDAVMLADTSQSDFDYNQLSRIYSQIEWIYLEEGFYKEALNAAEQARDNALLAHDTLLYWTYESCRANSFYQLCQYDSVLSVCKRVKPELERLNRSDVAALAQSPAFNVLIEQKRYSDAKVLMDYYERHSCLFDDYGEIKDVNKQSYFYTKGSYYMGMSMPDSAAWCFHRLLGKSGVLNDRVNAYRGLYELYMKSGITDSVMRYSRLYIDASDSLASSKATESMARISRMFEYEHYRKEAEQKRYEATAAETRNRWMMLAACTGIAAIAAAFALFRRRQRRRISFLADTYHDYAERLKETSRELDMLKSIHEESESSLNALLEEKAMEEERLRNMVQALEKKYNDTRQRQNITEGRMIKLITTVGENPVRKKLKPTDWDNIQNIVKAKYPKCHSLLQSKIGDLSPAEIKICCLSFLGIKPKLISNILHISQQSVTNYRIRLLNKLFDTNGSAKEFDDRVEKLKQMES